MNDEKDHNRYHVLFACMQPVGYIDGMSERVGRQQSDGEKQCRFCRPNGRNGGARQSDGCRAYGGDNGRDNVRDGDCGVRCRYGKICPSGHGD